MDYQELVDGVSALLAAPATLEDRDFTLIAFAAHDEATLDFVRARSILNKRSSAEVRAWFESFGIATAKGPLRTPADPETGIRSRVCIPARHAGVTYGYLWLLDDGRISLHDPRLASAVEAAREAGALLSERARSASAPSRSFALLLSDDPGVRAGAVRSLKSAVRPPYTIVVLRGDVQPPFGAIAHHDSAGLSILVPLRTHSDLAPARTLAASPATDSPQAPTPAGVGSPRSELAEARDCWDEARASARVAAAIPSLGPIAAWDDLGAYRTLSSMPPAPPDPAVLPLLTPAHADLRHTAETYLDQAGHVQRAAAALNIHRQTLYYRLARIEELTGLDLSDGLDRLLLHTALKLLPLHSP